MPENGITGPFLSTRDAAEYCSYNYDHFRILARKYSIPRRGPGNNRFSRSDLDRWMIDPDCFQDKPSKATPLKRKVKNIQI